MEKELIRQLLEALQEYSTIALATIIQTWGSTPRKAGAKMIICPDGRTYGTIGGGCGEGEVKAQAMLVIDKRKPILHQIHMVEEVAADEGMVCGGKMQVYIEPVFGVEA